MKTKELDKIIEEIFTNIVKQIGYIQSEYVYQNAFAIELCKRNIINKQEFAIPVTMNGEYLGEKRIDIAIFYKDENNLDQKYLLELKAKKHYKEHNRQLFGYSLTTQSKGQALVNFYEGWVEYQHENNLKFSVSYSNTNKKKMLSKVSFVRNLVLDFIEQEAIQQNILNPEDVWLKFSDLQQKVRKIDGNLISDSALKHSLKYLVDKGVLIQKNGAGYQSAKFNKLEPNFFENVF